MRLPFELDPQIIHHIIYSQAGSIGKAIIELIMNSVDAESKTVLLTITKTGFSCIDDGNGFASRKDVLRYFGRFGTPHKEGDATYGRFRLGRGQIMAHASTVWVSGDWKMTVDTREMGYNYDLETLLANSPGCAITGTWYEPLSDTEYLSTLQEIRDLVRYTPVTVELNKSVITRDPRIENWDHEDEYAYYRAKENGPVSIYNLGVLVRNDSSHTWGAGGIIVSKKAISLNVSRTEILRKTCATWKPIEKQFTKLADVVAARLGDHRKTEERRSKSARALLADSEGILNIYEKEEVITILPGKRHITFSHFLRMANLNHKSRYAAIENSFDVPKGEAIAKAGIAMIIHPHTLQRFGCYNPEDFRETIERIIENIKLASSENSHTWGVSWLHAPKSLEFAVLKDAFKEQTEIVSEKTLDKETRRAWVALRWCVQQYAGLCAGGEVFKDGKLAWRSEHRFSILLGESNAAEAWTDGASYIAFNKDIVKKLKTEPLTTAARILTLTVHEVAHQGDSIDCGHDEAFYARYHDISVKTAADKQRYLHMFLMKYTYSMEGEGKRGGAKAWEERFLVDRAGSGRQKRGLPRVIEDFSAHPVVTTPTPPEDADLIRKINFNLYASGLRQPPNEWDRVFDAAREASISAVDARREDSRRRAAEQTELEAEREADKEAEYEAGYRLRPEKIEEYRKRYVDVLKVDASMIDDSDVEFLFAHSSDDSDDSIRGAWDYLCDPHQGHYVDHEEEFNEEVNEPFIHLDEENKPLVREGETPWLLQRNAAAAGFRSVNCYLKWRSSLE